MIAPGKQSEAVSISDAFNDIRADYNMSRESRFVRRRTGFVSQGSGADWHYRNELDYYRDIEKARDMDRNDSIVGQTVDRAVGNIVQDGFTLDTKTGDKKLDADLLARWNEWSRDPDLCDVTGEHCFHDFERHSCRSMLVDGDCVNLGIDGGQLQHLEAHTIQTSTKQPNTFLGVTRSAQGERTRYWVARDPQDPARGTRERSVPVNTRNEAGTRTLFHVMSPRRMSQTRGITAFAPVFELTGMFEDIQFAKLVQEQVVSCFAIFRKQSYLPNLPGSTDGPNYGERATEATPAGTRYIENIAPGMEIIGKPGEELQGFSPNVPNTEYFEHVRLMMQMIGVNLGLPLCLVLMDGSETNYSGWRGAVDEARKGFRANQRNLIERLHAPLYRWHVHRWMARDGAIRRAASRPRVNVFDHKWNAPAWSYINPVDDAKADALRLQNALTSPRRLHAERGGIWEEISAETIADNQMAVVQAKKAAASINKKYPDDPPVHWRELINLPMPNGVQMGLDATREGQTNDE